MSSENTISDEKARAWEKHWRDAQWDKKRAKRVDDIRSAEDKKQVFEKFKWEGRNKNVSMQGTRFSEPQTELYWWQKFKLEEAKQKWRETNVAIETRVAAKILEDFLRKVKQTKSTDDKTWQELDQVHRILVIHARRYPSIWKKRNIERRKKIVQWVGELEKIFGKGQGYIMAGEMRGDFKIPDEGMFLEYSSRPHSSEYKKAIAATDELTKKELYAADVAVAQYLLQDWRLKDGGMTPEHWKKPETYIHRDKHTSEQVAAREEALNLLLAHASIHSSIYQEEMEQFVRRFELLFDVDQGKASLDTVEKLVGEHPWLNMHGPDSDSYRKTIEKLSGGRIKMRGSVPKRIQTLQQAQTFDPMETSQSRGR